MKRLKYMSMMGLAALLLTTWSACSDDTDIPGGENPEEARVYTTVTIAVPNGVAEQEPVRRQILTITLLKPVRRMNTK